MLGGWGLTDEKSYDAVSTKLSCKTFDKRLHSICIWFRNEPFFLRDIQIQFLREAVPLACHPSSRLQQSAGKHTVLRSWQVPSPARELQNPHSHLVRVGGGGRESKQSAWRILRFGGFLLLVRFSLFLFIFKPMAECTGLNYGSLGKSGCCWEARGCNKQAGSEAVLQRHRSVPNTEHLWDCVYRSGFAFLILPWFSLLSLSGLFIQPSKEDLPSAGHYGKQVCSFLLPFGRQIIAVSWKHSAWVKGHGVPALLSTETSTGRNPFCWCSWAESLLPVLWLPKPSLKPSNLLSMNHLLSRESQPLLGRNRALSYPYSATPQKSMVSWNVSSLRR